MTNWTVWLHHLAIVEPKTGQGPFLNPEAVHFTRDPGRWVTELRALPGLLMESGCPVSFLSGIAQIFAM